MFVRYKRNFAIGFSTHAIECYEIYTAENGLEGEPFEKRESTRISDCLKGIKMTPVQRELIKRLAKEKHDGIALPDGRYKAY